MGTGQRWQCTEGLEQEMRGGRDSRGDTGTLMGARARGRASDGPSLEPHPREHPPSQQRTKARMGVRRQSDRTSKVPPAGPFLALKTVLSWQGGSGDEWWLESSPPIPHHWGWGTTAQVPREVRSQPPHGGT